MATEPAGGADLEAIEAAGWVLDNAGDKAEHGPSDGPS
jgi:hypothetical protein